jgi:hypothetical protein
MANGEEKFIAVVYLVETNKYQTLIQCEHEISAMCTPGSDYLLIVGTTLGSVLMYDLKNPDINEFLS